MTDPQGRSVTDEGDFETSAFEVGGVTPVARGHRATVQQRTTPIQFAREVRDELRQVAWPNRAEMVNYSLVVFFTLVIMISLIFVLNWLFGHGVLFLFQK